MIAQHLAATLDPRGGLVGVAIPERSTEEDEMKGVLFSIVMLPLFSACSSEPNDSADTSPGDTFADDPGDNADTDGPEPDDTDEPDEDPPVDFTRGVYGLFAGQSFFVPVAQAFDAAAGQGDLPDHAFDSVFAGGPNGSPQALWETPAKKAEIEGYLATGEVDLFGLTIGNVNPDNPAEFYGRWIELALGYNPDTDIFIGFPHLQNGPSKTADAFETEITEGGEAMFGLVEALRTFYPDTDIDFVNYGLVLSEMMEDFEAGELEDIQALAAPAGGGDPADRATYLFSDPGIGHAGPMAEHICGLVWLNLLYGADISPFVDPAFDAEDVERIANEVIAFNEPYLPAAR